MRPSSGFPGISQQGKPAPARAGAVWRASARGSQPGRPRTPGPAQSVTGEGAWAGTAGGAPAAASNAGIVQS